MIGLYSHTVKPGNDQFVVDAQRRPHTAFWYLGLHTLVGALAQMTTNFFRGMGETYEGHLGTYALCLLRVPNPNE